MLKPSDFFENLRVTSAKQMSSADMANLAKSLTRSMGGRVTNPQLEAAKERERQSKRDAMKAIQAKADQERERKAAAKGPPTHKKKPRSK